jgi:hypothetical protein
VAESGGARAAALFVEPPANGSEVGFRGIGQRETGVTSEKKIFNEPFCRVLAHDGVKAML